MAAPFYLASRYMEVSDTLYAQYRDTVTRYGGTAETVAVPLPQDAIGGLSFVAGTRGEAPDVGDEICVGTTGRLDAFTAEARHFVLYES